MKNMTASKFEKGRRSTGKILELRDSPGSISDLITLQTGNRIKISKSKKELIDSIKPWMNNQQFNALRKELLDMAIVIYLDSRRYKTQDCDNIAHLVLNGLKKEDESDDYLFEDDCQIVRLLVYKLEAEKDEDFETNQIVISFRKHDPGKQMILDDVDRI